MEDRGIESFDISFTTEEPDGIAPKYDLDGTKFLLAMHNLGSMYGMRVDTATLLPEVTKRDRFNLGEIVERERGNDRADMTAWSLIWMQIGNLYIRKPFPVRAFYIGDWLLGDVLRRVCARLDMKVDAIVRECIEFGNSTDINSTIRMWKNRLSVDGTVNIIVSDRCDQRMIAFVLSTLARGGHAIVRVDFAMSPMYPWMFWFTQLFTESSIVCVGATARTYICGENFIGMSSKLRECALDGTCASDTCAQPSAHYPLFIEKLGAINDVICTWKLAHVKKILDLLVRLRAGNGRDNPIMIAEAYPQNIQSITNMRYLAAD